MKKIIRVTNLHNLDSRTAKNSLITISRYGKSLWTQNIELDGCQIVPNLEKDEVSITFKLRDGEYLVMQDEEGTTDKMKFNPSTRTWEKM